MNLLLDPNIGYALLMGGVALAVLALLVPGSGLLELGAFFALFFAGYIMVNLPVNTWAILLLLFSLILLTLAVRWRKGGWAVLLGSIGVMFIGSLFVFRNAAGGPAVNPFVALAVSGGLAWLLWFMARKTLEAAVLHPSFDLDKLVGQTGIARTDLNPLGSVYVGGENWSAHSQDTILTGSVVRVLKRDGLVLEVEKKRTEE
jgi:membrane-bound serine protease (ClpP class)